MTNSQDRPEIPADMARNIRRRCRYGCVMCGNPIYEYHHIHGFDPAVGHVEREITLLCDGCHRKEQNKVIPKSVVIEADGNPYNKKAGTSTPERIWYSDRPVRAKLGANEVVSLAGQGKFTVLALDGHPVIE